MGNAVHAVSEAGVEARRFGAETSGHTLLFDSTRRLLFSGGVLYTAGAVVLARNRPDPLPSTYGYHEIWHTCVIAATACHYSLILLITLGAR